MEGNYARDLLAANDVPTLAASSLGEVCNNIALTGYPMERFIITQGDVRATLPKRGLEKIALLRLDTDWYESTQHELTQCYPKLQNRGVLIIDDYGHWNGARRAVDEFLAGLDKPQLLSRIDYTGRILVKG